MSERLAPRTVLVHPDADSVKAAGAARLITKLIDLQSTQAPIHIVLTGGSVGIGILAEVANSPAAQAVDWSNTHVWWGDERFLPEGDPDRNETQAREALLDHLGETLPADNVHPMPALNSAAVPTPAASAALYAEELARFAKPGSAAPEFDILMLGMGPDGHIASLFPGLPGVEITDQTVVGVEDSPKPPPQRVSLTLPVIQGAKEVWVSAAGADKAPAVARALQSDDVSATPAAAALGRGASLWLIDVAASQDLR